MLLARQSLSSQGTACNSMFSSYNILLDDLCFFVFTCFSKCVVMNNTLSIYTILIILYNMYLYNYIVKGLEHMKFFL